MRSPLDYGWRIPIHLVTLTRPFFTLGPRNPAPPSEPTAVSENPVSTQGVSSGSLEVIRSRGPSSDKNSGKKSRTCRSRGACFDVSIGERVQPVETNRKPGSELNTARRYYDAIHDVDDPEGL
jgi:hypothetical protein